MKKTQRILALLGVALVAVAVLTMTFSGLAGSARDLALNISLVSTGAAAAILVGLLLVRNREKQQADDEKDS